MRCFAGLALQGGFQRVDYDEVKTLNGLNAREVERLILRFRFIYIYRRHRLKSIFNNHLQKCVLLRSEGLCPLSMSIHIALSDPAALYPILDISSCFHCAATHDNLGVEFSGKTAFAYGAATQEDWLLLAALYIKLPLPS